MTNLIRSKTKFGKVYWKYGKHIFTYYQGVLVKALKESYGNTRYFDPSFAQQIISLSKKGIVRYQHSLLGKDYWVTLVKK